MSEPVNVTGNVSGIGSRGVDDKLKVPKSAAEKYKKRNRLGFLEFVRRGKPGV
jgi:hypothetical protein